MCPCLSRRGHSQRGRALLRSEALHLWYEPVEIADRVVDAHKRRRTPSVVCGAAPCRVRSAQDQKSQSSSSVSSALPITYEDPEPEKKSWFSSALGDSEARIAGFTSV